MNKKSLALSLILSTAYTLLFPVGVFGAAVQNTNPGGDQSPTLSGNVEVGEVVWVNNVLQVRTRANGTGTIRSAQLTTGTSNVGVVVNSSGNVGVGTASPSYRLDVNGSARMNEILGTGINSQGGGGQNVGYISPNALAFADKRWTVSVTNVSSPSYLFDLNATLSIIDRTVGNGIVTIDYGTSYYYQTGLTINFDRHGNYSYAQNILAEYSSDGSTWTTLVNTTTNADRTFYYPGAIPLHRYFRVTMGNPNDSARNIGIESINLYNDTYEFTYNGALPLSGGTIYGGIAVNAASSFTQPVAVGTPTAATHATTKSYVDSLVGGGGGAGSFATLSVTGTSTLATSGGNVGIGTTSPTEKLHVGNGGYVMSGGYKIDGAGLFFLDHSGVSFQASNGARIWNRDAGANADTYLSVSNDSGVQVEGLRIKHNTGNVGIGTTNPGYKLEVTGVENITNSFGNPNAESAYRLKFYDNGGTYNDAGIGLDGAAGGEKMWFNTISGFYFNYGTAGQKITFDPSGNVGIGNTAPGYKLDVAGTGNFTQPVIVGTPTAAGHAATKSYVDSATTGQTGWTDGGGNVYLTTATDNVGIGTTSPGAKLDIASGDIYFSGARGRGIYESYMSLGETLNSAATIIGNNVRVSAANNSSVNRFRSGTDPGNFIKMVYNGGITFHTNVTSTLGTDVSETTNERVRIDLNGNVGIGTTSPGQLLHLNGTNVGLQVSTNGYGGTSYASYLGSGSGATGYLQLGNNGTNYIVGGNTAAGGKLDFIVNNSNAFPSTPNGVEAMTMLASGNVGVGNTAPGYKLDVTGTGNFTQPVIVGTPTAAGHAATKSYVDSSVATSPTWTLSGSNIYNSNSGNVGIGTTNPITKLSVDGVSSEFIIGNIASYPGSAARIGTTRRLNYLDTMISRNLSGVTGADTYQTPHTAANAGYQGMEFKYPGDIAFYAIEGATTAGAIVTPTARMWIDGSAGNVGIGTTAPGGKLHVAFVAADTNRQVAITDENGAQAVVVPTGNGVANASYANFGYNFYASSPSQLVYRGGTNAASGVGFGSGINFWTAPAAAQGTNLTPTVQMYITNGGNVGIGVSPSYKLDVTGTGNFTQPVIVGTPTAAGHATTKSYVDSAVTSGVTGGISGTLNYVSKFTGTNTVGSSQIFDNGTSVGIGTTVPSARLSIVGNEDNTRFSQDTGYVYTELAQRDWSGTYGFLVNAYKSSSSVSGGLFTTGNTKYKRSGGAYGEGAVAIGGDLNNGTSGGSLQFFSAASSTADSNVSWTQLSRLDLSTIWFSPRGTSVDFNINSSGNVGIGVSPSYKLDVTGTGNFTQPVIVGTPTAAGHAATKSYVDSAVTGGTGTGSFSTITVSGTSTFATAAGRVGIGNSAPTTKLDVTGGAIFSSSVSASAYYDGAYYFDGANTGTSLSMAGAINADGTGTSYIQGNTGIGTSAPGTYKLYVNGTSYFANQMNLAAGVQIAMTNNTNSIAMASGNITGVNKITVSTIDPLYEIEGGKYATFAPSIAGGVKEEYVGRARLEPTISNSESRISNGKTIETRNSKLNNSDSTYTYTIDFNTVPKGSDLWVWYKAIDFSKDNIEVMATAYGTPVAIAYEVKNNSIVFKTNGTTNDDSIEFSFRLIGKRHDWKEWPTYAKDQAEKASFIIK